MRISYWSSDVCSSDLPGLGGLDVAGDLDVVEVDRVRTGAGGVGGHAVRAHGGITGVAGTDHPKPLGARLVGQDAAGQRVVAQDVDRVGGEHAGGVVIGRPHQRAVCAIAVQAPRLVDRIDQIGRAHV